MVDRYGRKIPLVCTWSGNIVLCQTYLQYIGALFMLVGALVGGLTHTRAEFMGARVLLGVGTAFAREP